MTISRSFLGAVVIAACVSAQAAPKEKTYRFEAYDVPSDVGTETALNGLNNPGALVGSFLSLEGDRDGFIASKRKFDEVVVPGSAPANRGTVAGIGENGRAVGTFSGTDGATHIFLRTKKGEIEIQSDPAGAISTYAGGINNPGTVVGWFEDENNELHGFTLRRGNYSTYDYPGAVDTKLTGINDNGQTVGFWTDDSEVSHGFLLRNGSATSIAYPGATGTQPLGINDRGQIVGTYIDTEGNNRGFLYDRGEYKALDFPGALDTIVTGIDDSGEIVGVYDGVHGFTATTKRGRGPK